MSLTRKWLTCVASLLILSLAGCAHTNVQTNNNLANATAKIAPALAAVAAKLEAGADPQSFAQGMVRADAQGRVQVYVRLNEITADELGALKANGLVNIVPSPALHVVQGWVKPENLTALAALPFVIRITPPSYGHPG